MLVCTIKINPAQTFLPHQECYHSTQDTFRLETPGGGGYGIPVNDNGSTTPPKTRPCVSTMPSGSLENYRIMQESA